MMEYASKIVIFMYKYLKKKHEPDERNGRWKNSVDFLGLKCAVSERKNLLDKINSKLGSSEEKLSKLESTEIEVF
jgi:hypothetical protein